MRVLFCRVGQVGGLVGLPSVVCQNIGVSVCRRGQVVVTGCGLAFALLDVILANLVWFCFAVLSATLSLRLPLLQRFAFAFLSFGDFYL